MNLGRYEMVDEEHNTSKFWSIKEIGEDQYETRWGRIGTSGQSQVINKKDAERKVREKLKKGYTLTDVKAMVLEVLREAGIEVAGGLVRRSDLAKLAKASNLRDCSFYKATDGRWYMDLEDERYDDEDEDGYRSSGDMNSYGPFNSEEAAEKFLRNFSNPGGYDVDSSGRRKPPASAIRPGRTSYGSALESAVEKILSDKMFLANISDMIEAADAGLKVGLSMGKPAMVTFNKLCLVFFKAVKAGDQKAAVKAAEELVQNGHGAAFGL
jgi:predicted DNA-binding WGR domain protein